MRYGFRIGFALALSFALMAGCSENGGEGIPECEGPDDCDDGEECTADTCTGGVCEYTTVTDGTACGNGECLAGVCACHPPEDRCPGFPTCEDDDPCTRGVCSLDGTCSQLPACDDFNDCTVDTCDPQEICDPAPPYCYVSLCSEPIAVADGTPCSGGTCQGGVCALNGSVLPCTEQGIRNAVAAGGGPYTFACEGAVTVLTQAPIEIGKDVVLDGEGKLTVNGNCDHNVFFAFGDVTAELYGFTITNACGPAIRGGTLTVARTTVSGSCGTGAIDVGIMTVLDSTISGNLGMGIGNWGGTLTVMNSTVSRNTGPGIRSLYGGTTTLTNVTVSKNAEAGIRHGVGMLTLQNTLVDGMCLGDSGGNPVPLPPSEDTTSLGHNIESPGNTCRFDQTTDQVNVTAEQLNLGPLQDNGGPTETHALLPGSVAIDQIPEAACEVDEDQRGVARPQGPTCDVGAFEVEMAP